MSFGVSINKKELEIRLPFGKLNFIISNKCLGAEIINVPLGASTGDPSIPVPVEESLLLVAPLVFMGTDSGIGDNLKIA